MIKTFKDMIKRLFKMQDGIAFPSVIALLAVGSLIILPALNYATTSLQAGSQAAEEFKGIITADAGIEDALWKIKHDSLDFLEPYTINSVNDFSIDIDIDEVNIIAGEVVNSGVKADEFIIEASVNETIISENLSTYYYTLSATNNGSGLIKPEMFLIDFPSGLDYVTDSTSSNMTKPVDSNPTSIVGIADTGITLIWDNNLIPGGLPCLSVGETGYLYFQLSGRPGITGVEGHGFVAAEREDIGDIWIGNVVPYAIIVHAKNMTGERICTIRAGVWAASNGDLEISCWQVLP